MTLSADAERAENEALLAAMQAAGKVKRVPKTAKAEPKTEPSQPVEAARDGPGAAGVVKEPRPPTVIPDRLRRGDLRFIKIPAGSKGGSGNEKGWQTTANYAWDDPRLQLHLEAGGNYGIFPAAGSPVVIIDADAAGRLRELVTLPPTFTAETGGSTPEAPKFHLFYVTEGPPLEGKWPFFDPEQPGRDHLGEVYAQHPESAKGYVVGPNSLHPSGARYQVVNDQPMAPLPDELRTRLEGMRSAKGEKDRQGKKEPAQTVLPAPDGTLSERLNLRVTDFLMPKNARLRDGEWEGEHPVHGSETGTNLTCDDGRFYCRRCDSGGGPLEALAVAEGIIDCSEAGPGCLKDPKTWAKVLKALKARGYVVPGAPARKAAAVGRETAAGAPPVTSEDFARFVYKAGRDRYQINDSMVAEFVYEHHHVVSFNDVLYVYENGIYARDKGAISAEVKRFVDGCGTHEPITRVLREVRQHLLATNPYPNHPFNREPDLIPVANGVIRIDYKTGKIEHGPHSPAFKFTYRLPVTYDPKATPDLALGVLGEYVPPEDLPLLVQPLAQALLQAQLGMPYKKNYLLQGNRHGGKSTYTKVLDGFFGGENIARVSLQDITANRFSYARLEDKLVNYYDDLTNVPLEYIGKFKAVTGSCEHDVEDKFEKKHGGRITCPHVFTCNRPPRVSDSAKTDDAWWERWEYVRFPFAFPVDPTFAERVLTPAFFSSLLRAVLDMMIAIRRSGGLTINRTSAEVQERWSIMADPLYQFLDAKMDRQQLAMHDFDKGKLWRAYLVWCEEANIDLALRLTKPTGFTKAVEHYGLVCWESSKMVGGRKRPYEVYRGQWKWRGSEDMGFDFGPFVGGGEA